MKEEDRADYEELFIQFSKQVERVLFRFLFVLFVLLLCCQALLQIPYVSMHFTKVAPLEGIPYMEKEQAFPGRR
ncbi:DUF5359 family protein [Paenibacillus eucommiae]|uniref:Uncharacterized protein n=1 Tax=Paenibacillus eucommiae TaxID=1355755 RepID=A0ABS4IP15_9BACL|nr:DUF5359 family protein [Paenibacillus eucommiae]MBP1988915.1 hypothetical protein [Paenibacillus eucommiae]